MYQRPSNLSSRLQQREQQVSMHSSIHNSKQNNLSHFYNMVKQCSQLRKQAKFYFGQLLNFQFSYQPSKIKNDLSKQQYQQLLKNLSFLVSDVFSFYDKNPPPQVYKLLHLSRTIFGLDSISSQDLPKNSSIQGHNLLMYQIYFTNTLCFFLIKNKQYSSANQCFQFIVDIVRNEKVDIYNQIILTSISNYLSVLRTQELGSQNDKIKQLSQFLVRIYRGLLNRFDKLGCLQSSLLCFLSVYRQNEKLLCKRFQNQNKLLIKKYQQINKIKQNYVYTDQNKIHSYMLLNRSKKAGKININENQITFLAPYSLKTNIRFRKLNNSVELKRSNNQQGLQINQLQLQTINRDSNGFQRSQLRKSRYVQISSINKTIDMALKKLSTQKRIQLQRKNEKKKHIKLFFKNQTVIVKVNYSVMEIRNDAIIISDFLRERKKFLTWFQVSNLLKLLKFSPLFYQYLPIVCFYDIAKILSFYIYKSSNDSHWGAAVLDVPKQLVEINIFTKLYKTQGPYLKIFAMNQYDENHLQLELDCYLDQFDVYFKKITSNQYIQRLNKKILKQPYRQQIICSLQVWKKKMQYTNTILADKCSMEEILDFPYLKSSQFRLVLLMPDKKQILLYLKEKDQKQQQQKQSLILPITVINLKQSGKQHKLNVPLYKVMKYFPVHNIDIIQWMKKYGKFIFQAYYQCFQNCPSSFYNSQYLNVVTYAKKTQMVEQGKYKTPVMVQIIGTKNRIWGFTFRYFQQFSTLEKVIFIFNPYYQLLQPVIKLGATQRREVLIQHLFQGSVAKTYDKLKQAKLEGKMVNLIHYWTLIDF